MAPRELEKRLDELEISGNTETIQNKAQLGYYEESWRPVATLEE